METLFRSWANEDCITRQQISANGSNRMYFRLKSKNKSCIAAVNHDVRENEAFFSFAHQLRQHGVPVPEIYAVSDDRTTYLQQDLGDTTVYNYILSRRTNNIDVQPDMLRLYGKAVELLVEMQNKCKDIDYSLAYPRPDFDRQALMWDFNYFKYYFLKLFHIPFDEQLLEQDYNTLCDFLLSGETDCFVHRDFQSRNFMLSDEQLYFIDFQGARRGSPFYDLAAMLYSAKSDLPDNVRHSLLQKYIQLSGKTDDCQPLFYGYVLARILQAMGAYGYRGIIEKKDHFVKSIPIAVNNLRKLIDANLLPPGIPHLSSVLASITQIPEYNKDDKTLSVSVFSFSYRKGIPFDKTGNGGGFVFDCRALPNPGLFDEYRTLNGRDAAVIEFFRQHPETDTFINNIQQVLSQAIESYMERGYTNLMVNFGCTGGRHRSVYCAEQISKFIRQNYACNVSIHHLEQSRL